MKRIFALILLLTLLLVSCTDPTIPEDTEEEMGYDYYAINMDTDFKIDDNLPEANGKKARVIILIGQSNATGCSLTS